MALYALASMGKPRLMAMRRHASGITALTALTALVGGLYLAACSGSQPKPNDDFEPPMDEPTEPAMDPEPGDDPGDDPVDEPSEDPPPKKAQPANDDYDMTYRDCKTLAGTYQRAWERVEREKLDKKNFKPKLYDTALKNVQRAAKEAGDHWLAECEGMVGSPYLYSRLKCALKAKTVERFNDCWDGKAE
jgi:hypothetical protein